jgi:ferredoxin
MPRKCEWLDGCKGCWQRCPFDAVRNENGRQLSWCATHAKAALKPAAERYGGRFRFSSDRFAEGVPNHLTIPGGTNRSRAEAREAIYLDQINYHHQED